MQKCESFTSVHVTSAFSFESLFGKGPQIQRKAMRFLSQQKNLIVNVDANGAEYGSKLHNKYLYLKREKTTPRT